MLRINGISLYYRKIPTQRDRSLVLSRFVGVGPGVEVFQFSVAPSDGCNWGCTAIQPPPVGGEDHPLPINVDTAREMAVTSLPDRQGCHIVVADKCTTHEIASINLHIYIKVAV